MPKGEEPFVSHIHPIPVDELEKLGVRVLNKHELSLECISCGEVWAPKYHSDGTLSRGYWHCPNRCNV